MISAGGTAKLGSMFSPNPSGSIALPNTGPVVSRPSVFSVSVPLPVASYEDLKDGENFWSDLPDNFFTTNEFPPCGVNISGPSIMSQSEADM